MMKQVLYIPFFMLLISCHDKRATSQPSDSTVISTALDTLTKGKSTPDMIIVTDTLFSSINNRFPWLGDSIRSYIRLSTNEMVRQFVSDSSVVFMYDGVQDADAGSYVSIRIGADVDNGDGTVFSTAECIYIKTSTRDVYRYDIAEDSSYLWVRPQ